MSFEIVLNNVVDLTDPRVQTILQTNHTELTGNWSNYPGPGIAPTQELGYELFKLVHLEGFIYHSSKTNAECLAIFPEKLGPGSTVTFYNEISSKLERLV